MKYMQRKEDGILHLYCSWFTKTYMNVYNKTGGLYLQCFKCTRIAHVGLWLGINAGFVGWIELP